MASFTVDLSDPHLFGNDAAEDEDSQVFESYVFERPELRDFAEPRHAIRIARAYKGEGKSALLRLTRARVGPQAVIVSTTGPSLSPTTTSVDFDAWIREWKRRIFDTIACEIGSGIGMAWTDDAISLVELAEKNGFKQRNPVSAIIDRLKSKVVPVERTRVDLPDAEQVLSRWNRDDTQIWLLVDDIDQNFQNTEPYKHKVASFFAACRQVMNAVPAIRFRLAIRPNVWTMLKRDFESLSHVEQYAVDLKWDDASIRSLLARRVEGYLIRQRLDRTLATLPPDRSEAEEALIAMAFEPRIQWGKDPFGKPKQRPPHVVLSTLSRHRPRWLIELCKEAARSAQQLGGSRIRLRDMTGQLATFGRHRIDDTVAEFRSQCPDLNDIISAFASQREEYSTDELLATLSKRLPPSVPIRIAGLNKPTEPKDIAKLLFQIGFLTARQNTKTGYEHFSFSDRPELLDARSNFDQGVRWEIHPVFRQALGLRSDEGRELNRPRT